MDLPLCSLKSCRKNSDCNCRSLNDYGNCEFTILKRAKSIPNSEMELKIESEVQRISGIIAENSEQVRLAIDTSDRGYLDSVIRAFIS